MIGPVKTRMRDNRIPQFHRIIFAILLLSAQATNTAANGEADFQLVTFGSAPSSLNPPVDFLEDTPKIDGRLDDSLQFLPARQFNYVYHLSRDTIVPASYRLGYGATFLYLYLEIEADHLIFRDRAYQNGDGFQLVIAAPKSDHTPTGEFYVLACSAVNDPSQEWTRRIFWYYNVDKIFLPTSENTKLESLSEGGKVAFELLLPWADVHPYHPWLTSEIGFNLRLVKATEPDGVMVYGLVDDPNLDSEQRTRQYALLSFREPNVKHSIQTFFQPLRSHLTHGDSLEIARFCLAPDSSTYTCTVSLHSGEGERLWVQRLTAECKSTLNRNDFWINTSTLPPGGYAVRWSVNSGMNFGERGLTILPAENLSALANRIESISKKISLSSLNTLQFRRAEIERQLQSTYAYETCGGLRTALAELLTTMEHAEKGVDDLNAATGFVRKAYRSKMDSTLQPYMLWLPADFTQGRTYPLMVYLHGSASDERSFARSGARDMIPPGFIAVAPYGRGKSNAFTADHAQEDIAEVIDAVCNDYSIDRNAILLTGFSMGGYGVLRTAYESPGKFRALAIISGDPSLAARYTGDSTQPNFLDERYLRALTNLPAFVFHGQKDNNAPFRNTQELVDKLRKLGAQVQFITDPNSGHDFPQRTALTSYFQWVDQILLSHR